MGRRYELFIGAAIASLLALSGGAGCTQEGATVVMLQNQVPEDGCMVSASIGAPFLPRGFIDAQATRGYIFTPLVQNFATAGDTASDAQRLAFIEGAEIRVSLPSGLVDDAKLADLRQRNLLEFTQAFSATISPDGGLTALVFELIPKELLDELRDSLPENGAIVGIKTTVQLFGKLGGSAIDSQEFVYWVDACDGCAIVNLGECALLDSSADVREGGACNLLQDAYLDCCTDAGGALVCPAKPTSFR